MVERRFERRSSRIRQPVLISSRLAWVGIETDFLTAMAAEPAAMIPRLIHGDPVDPRLERAFAAERRDVAEHLEEHFLHDVGSVGRIIHQAADYVEYRLLKTGDQDFVCGLGPKAQVTH